jgi:hypothetical protein
MPDTAGNGDIWKRFHGLCQVADVRVSSSTDSDAWVVTARREGEASPSVERTGPHLVAALIALLEATEHWVTTNRRPSAPST